MKPVEARLLASDEAIADLRERSIARWLIDFALEHDDEEALLGGFCERLREVGVPLVRASAASNLLHPILEAQGLRWLQGQGTSRETYPRTPDDDDEEWRRSPFYHLIHNKVRELRRRLDDCYCVGEFPLVDRLKCEGCTDYLAFSVWYSEISMIGQVRGLVCSFQTDRAGGFTDQEVELLRSLVPALGLAYKCINGLLTGRILMSTYLGEDAGRRVVTGSIARGVAEKVRAVLWYSDLQRFTNISETLPPDELMGLLNDYAEVVATAIQDHQGQILKFIGDGIFGMFPVDGHDDEACIKALDAAVALRLAVDRLNERRSAEKQPVTGFYLALHVGEVLYGNIGSRDRLDFTVVGPAVNETARIEAMCRSLDQWLVVSSAFAEASGKARDRLLSLGRYALRGVSRPQELFTVDPGG